VCVFEFVSLTEKKRACEFRVCLDSKSLTDFMQITGVQKLVTTVRKICKSFQYFWRLIVPIQVQTKNVWVVSFWGKKFSN